MTHRRRGLYRLLETAGFYRGLQELLGGRGARASLVSEFLEPLEGMRLLEIGCGTGWLLEYLPRSVEYLGYDLNPSYVEAARARFGDRGSFHEASVGMESEVIAGKEFDVVVALGMLHHLSDREVRALLEAANGALVPGGRFVTSDPVLHEGQALIARVLARLDRGSAVRDPEGYLSLVRPVFEGVEGHLRTNRLRIPYSHFIMQAVRSEV